MIILLLGWAISAYGWVVFLDWAVVAIPTIAGLAQSVLPVSPTTKHRAAVLIGCVLLSALIYLQQHESRASHSAELARLATKDDIAGLPTADEIVDKFVQLQEPRIEPARPAGEVPTPTGKSQTKESTPATAEDVTKGVERLESLIRGQKWGLSASQLVTLAKRMAPFKQENPDQPRDRFITGLLGNSESIQFATALVAAFKSAGWDLPGSGFAQALFAQDVQGVILQVHSRDYRPAGFPEFVSVLNEAGITPVGHIKASIPPGQFRVIVGRKPD